MKPGGVTRFVESVVALNQPSGTRHDLLTTFADGPEPAQGDYTVHRLELGRRGVLACLREARRIYRRYDSVMVHGAHPVVMLPLLGLRRRVVLFQHGMAVSSGPRVVRAAKKAWFSLVPWLLDTHTVCSTEFAQRKSEALGVRFRRGRVHIIGFGTDVERKRDRSARSADSVTIGMAGRLDRQKRQHLVLESLRTYEGARRIRLLIAGDGPERSALEQIARSLPADRVQVTFRGTVANMESFYDDIDLLVFPSKGESFGLVALEALMRSVPVAVFPDVGGCLPLIRPGETGFIITGGAEGLRELWHGLDQRPATLTELQATISGLDFSEFTVARTRRALDTLASSSIWN
jgi:glycosyltransferase involved in cell wall biosynthesis